MFAGLIGKEKESFIDFNRDIPDVNKPFIPPTRSLSGIGFTELTSMKLGGYHDPLKEPLTKMQRIRRKRTKEARKTRRLNRA